MPGTQAAPGFEGFDFGRGGFGDVFNDIFEDFFGGQRGGSRAERGNDLQYNLEITFEESVYGKEAKLKIPRWETCSGLQRHRGQVRHASQDLSQLQGRRADQASTGLLQRQPTLRPVRGFRRSSRIPARPARAVNASTRSARSSVHIPAGIETGMRLRLSNEGEHGVNGGPRRRSLRRHYGQSRIPFSSAKATIFVCDVPINFVTAALGGKIEVPTLKGTTVMKVPPGTQPDKVLRLKGLGIPESQTSAQPAINCSRSRSHIPTKLTAKQRNC